MPNSTLPTMQLTVRAVVRNSREFRATEGANAGKVYYSADAEVATPGMRWTTLRLKVTGASPIPEGEQNLVVTTFSDKDGLGVAHVA